MSFAIRMLAPCAVLVMATACGSDQLPSSPPELNTRSSPIEWVQSALITNPDVTDYATGFGYHVDVSGDTLLVGAPSMREIGMSAGAAYIFERNPNSGQWYFTTKLVPDNAAASDELGGSVLIEKDRAVVGAPGKWGPDGYWTGAAYVFTRDPKTRVWSQEAALTASNQAPKNRFASAMGMSGDMLLVGCPDCNDHTGAVYVFQYNPLSKTWREETILMAYDFSKADKFGTAVALDGNRALIGAPGDDTTTHTDSGSVYIFERHPVNRTWSQVTKLQPVDAPSYYDFGWAADLSGNIALVATPYDNGKTGAVFVYERDPVTEAWNPTHKLQAAGGRVDDFFGNAISFSGNTAVIGATGYDAHVAAQDSGAVYVLVRDPATGTWTQQQRIQRESPSQFDDFGGAVALDNTRLVSVTSSFLLLSQPVYVFDMGASLGESCTTTAGCAVGDCADGTCCNTPCSGACDRCGLPGLEGKCSPAPRGGVPSADCAGFLCDGAQGACPVACSGDSDCAPTHYCNALANCEARLDPAAPCQASNQCTTGHCVDGVCCSSACSDACASCTLVDAVGTCSPVTIGQPGKPDCKPYVCDGTNLTCPSQCDARESCSEGLACVDHACVTALPLGTPCSADAQCVSNFCVDGVCCTTRCEGSCDRCDLVGKIGTCSLVPDAQQGTPSCAPYLCDGQSAVCPEACVLHSDCVAESTCIDARCSGKKSIGTACTEARECDSGYCTDGVCCTAACSGSCAHCNLEGSSGTCSPMPGGSLGAPPCAPYVCNGSALGCPTTCINRDDCAQGSACIDGLCGSGLPLGEVCQEASTCLSGFCTDGVCCAKADCGDYRCRADGSCAEECSSSAECARDLMCSSSRRCEPASVPSDEQVTDSSSSCSVNGHRQSQTAPSPFAIVLALSGLLLLRRRSGMFLPFMLLACSSGSRDDHRPIAQKQQALTWMQKGKLDGFEANPVPPFSTDIALSGNTIVVGAYMTSDAGTKAGAVHVFSRNPSTGQWNLNEKIIPDDVEANDQFGRTVAISADRFLAYADGYDRSLGSIFVYARDPKTGKWTRETNLRPTHPNASEYYGHAIAIYHDKVYGYRAAVTSFVDDAAYIFERAPTEQTWKQTAMLIGHGAVGSQFGYSVALDRNYCVVGDPVDSEHGYENGAVYVFERNPDGTWLERAKLSKVDNHGTYHIGYQVDLSDRTLVAGDGNGVQVFRRNTNDQWIFETTLTLPSSYDDWDLRAKVSGDRIVVGASFSNSDWPLYRVGAASSFLRDPTTGSWTLETEFWPADLENGGYFGRVLDIDHHRAIIGTSNPVYVFDVGNSVGEPCQHNDDCLQGFCSNAVCCDSACTGPCDRCNAPGHVGACTPFARGETPSSTCTGYLCNGVQTTCPDSCSEQPDCLSSFFCSTESHCEPKQPNGTACGSAVQCESTLCVDGVCCDRPCDGACTSCALPESLGSCTLNPGGHPGSPSCSPYVCNGVADSCPLTCTSHGDCSADYACSQGTCVPKTVAGSACSESATCTSGFCSDGVCCDSACEGACDRCDLPTSLGVCHVSPNGDDGSPSCNPYVCDGAQAGCPVSCQEHEDCTAEAACFEGTCKPRKELGSDCSLERECASGHCAQGICCDQGCNDGCGRCDVSPHVGTCSPMPFGSPGDPTCAPYRCDGTTTRCPSACGQDAPCISGYFCADQACSPLHPLGSQCQDSNMCVSAFCTDGVCCSKANCGDYRCRPDGSCAEECSSSAECAADLSCSSSGRCEPTTESTSDSGGSCSINRPSGPPQGWALFSLSLLAAAFARLRNRQRHISQ